MGAPLPRLSHLTRVLVPIDITPIPLDADIDNVGANFTYGGGVTGSRSYHPVSAGDSAAPFLPVPLKIPVPIDVTPIPLGADIDNVGANFTYGGGVAGSRFHHPVSAGDSAAPFLPVPLKIPVPIDVMPIPLNVDIDDVGANFTYGGGVAGSRFYHPALAGDSAAPSLPVPLNLDLVSLHLALIVKIIFYLNRITAPGHVGYPCPFLNLSSLSVRYGCRLFYSAVDSTRRFRDERTDVVRYLSRRGPRPGQSQMVVVV